MIRRVHKEQAYSEYFLTLSIAIRRIKSPQWSMAILCGILLIVGFIPIFSQVSDSIFSRPRYGIFGDFNYNQHFTDFKGLPGIPSCCPNFDQGIGSGITLGILYDIPFWHSLRLNLRGMYSSFGGTLDQVETVELKYNGSLTKGEFIHTIHAQLAQIGFEPMVQYPLTSRLHLNGGATFGYVLTKSYDQSEIIQSPEGGVFTDTDTRSRNVSSGTIPEGNSFKAALFGGMSYALPMNTSGSLFAEIELLLSAGLTKVVSTVPWNVHQLRAGVAVKYSPSPRIPVMLRDTTIQRDTIERKAPLGNPAIVLFDRADSTKKTLEIPEGTLERLAIAEHYIREIPPPPLKIDTIHIAIQPPKVDTLPIKPMPKLSAQVIATALENGVETPVAVFKITELIASSLRPLLTYIFFDKNASVLPERYVKLDSLSCTQFSVDDLYRQDILPTYYHILNIIGKRLQERPFASITLTGCTSDEEVAEGDTLLSHTRSIAIAKYLQNIWKIGTQRINIQARNLPEKASRTGEPQYREQEREENRRVEITSDDFEIIKPVFAFDTLRTSELPQIRIRSTVQADTGVAHWSLLAKHKTYLANQLSGGIAPPTVVDWDLSAETLNLPRDSSIIDVELSATDSIGQKVSAKGIVPVTMRRDRMANMENIIGSLRYEKFSLMLFDFDKSDIRGHNAKIIGIIQKSVQNDSRISIIGRTDAIGGEEHNVKLSKSRAISTAQSLGILPEVLKGIGEKDILYDVSLPEARHYNRVVDIVVETPIKKP